MFRKRINVSFGSVARNCKRGISAVGKGYNSLSTNAFRHICRAETDVITHKSRTFGCRRYASVVFVAEKFGMLYYFVHVFDGTNRIFSNRGFAAEHDGVHAVDYGICNIGGFGAGGAEVLNHTFHHLRGNNHRHSGVKAFLHNHFLQQRHFIKVKFHP